MERTGLNRGAFPATSCYNKQRPSPATRTYQRSLSTSATPQNPREGGKEGRGVAAAIEQDMGYKIGGHETQNINPTCFFGLARSLYEGALQ